MSKNTIITDLDGTISDDHHRRHLIEGKPKEWENYYRACVDDLPNLPVIHLLTAMHRCGFIINIFSGRDEMVRGETMSWLRDAQVPYNGLLMRPEGTNTPDVDLKRKWLHQIPDLKEQVLFVLDDRQRVVDMWRDEGLTCFQVAPGDF